jgi:hypothetical protein
MSDLNPNEQARASASMGLPEQPSPELPVSAIQPLAAATPTEPSVTSGVTGLAWWNANKYYWRQNASGNGAHLAPQDSYVEDVLDRCDHYMQVIAKDFGEDDYTEFAETAGLHTELIQAEDAVDTSGVEGNSARRNVLNRLIIARKICGASAVSAEHRVTNELSRETGDVEKLKGDSEGFYQSDVDKRERWGFKAIRLEFIAKHIADGEIIPTDDTAFSQLLAKRIQRSLYDDAVEQGNKLKRPQQKAAASTNKPSREELLALTA